MKVLLCGSAIKRGEGDNLRAGSHAEGRPLRQATRTLRTKEQRRMHDGSMQEGVYSSQP